jgi:hypothetical protein
VARCYRNRRERTNQLDQVVLGVSACALIVGACAQAAFVRRTFGAFAARPLIRTRVVIIEASIRLSPAFFFVVDPTRLRWWVLCAAWLVASPSLYGLGLLTLRASTRLNSASPSLSMAAHTGLRLRTAFAALVVASVLGGVALATFAGIPPFLAGIVTTGIAALTVLAAREVVRFTRRRISS